MGARRRRHRSTHRRRSRSKRAGRGGHHIAAAQRGPGRPDAGHRSTHRQRRSRSKRAGPEEGITPLHIGAVYELGPGRQAIAALIDAGADPNARDEEGITPLHSAAQEGQTEAIAALHRRRSRSKRAGRVGPDPLRSDPRGLPGCRNIGLPAFEGRPDRLTPSAGRSQSLSRGFSGMGSPSSFALSGALRAAQSLSGALPGKSHPSGCFHALKTAPCRASGRGPFRFCRFPGSGCWILALSLLSKFSELTTKRTGSSIALHPGQDFSRVVRSVECRVSLRSPRHPTLTL